ncbi:MAG: hypothetical protein JXJ20_10130 [Anaerolineae bacterium]|jgi:hypothetical protein|nr:hypothetical protein [Anaerolineae bacterium]
MSPRENYDQPRRRRGCWLWMIFAAVLVVFGGGTGAFVLNMADEPNEIRVQLSEPGRVAVNETVALEVTIENVSMDPVTINGVGLEQSLLDGIQVTGTDPAYTGSEDRNSPLSGDWTEYRLDRDLAAGDTLVVTLTLQGTEPGSYSGDVAVWIDSDVFGVSMARARREELSLDVQ